MRAKLLARLRTHPLSGAVGGDQFRELLLDRLQLRLKLIVFAVRNDGVVLHVVEMIVVGNFLPQLFGTLFRLLLGQVFDLFALLRHGVIPYVGLATEP